MEAWIVAVHRGPTGQRWQLPAAGSVVIGRVSEADILLDDGFVGRRHAQIRRTDQGDLFRFNGSGGGASIDERRCDGTETLLHDGAELRIGSVYLRYFCGPGADARSAAHVDELAEIDSLTRLPLGDPANAARISLRDIEQLRRSHGFVIADQLVRQIARRLAMLAAGDAGIMWTRDECFAVTPAAVAPRLVVEASLDPVYCEDVPVAFELVIE